MKFKTRPKCIAFEAVVVNNAEYVQMYKIDGISFAAAKCHGKMLNVETAFCLCATRFAFLICNSARRLISSEIFITVTC